MIYGSVCSGIEAATVAWESLGWKASFFSEIEPFPCAVLAHHYPDTPNLGDMTKFKEWPDACVCSSRVDGKPIAGSGASGIGGVCRTNVHSEHGRSALRCDHCKRFFAQYKCSASSHGECDCPKCQGYCACNETRRITCETCGGAIIDVLVGGTPCQSFSVAGLRKGLADPRGNLMLTYLAIANRYRPQWLVWENVPGVLSSNGGRDFGTFLGGLGELGYGFAYRILDAQYIRVDTHPRAVPQRRRRVFVVGYFGNWHPAAAVLFERESLCGHPAPRREAGQKPAGSLGARASGGGGFSTDFECAGGLQVAKTLTASTGHRNDAETDTWLTFATPAIGDIRQDDVASTISRNTGAGGETQNPAFVAYQTPAVVTDDSQRASQKTVAGGALQVRRLLPVECEKLQGFPPGYTDVPYRGKPAADGPRYKALGNSMAINVMRWIGERIEKVDKILK